MEDETKKITIEALVLTEGKYVGPTVGVSMLPMLKTGRDSVVIRKKEGRLKPLDVALYKRGEKYVLHRVISAVDGGYIIRGDNCYSNEAVPESAVFGVLTEYFRGDKHIDCATDKKYLRYAKRRVKNYPLRKAFVPFFQRCRHIAARAYRKIFPRKKAQTADTPEQNGD
ncbi:MAG: hypothetical protein ACI4SH_07890 [Candidatus Scatosoma sp.]